MRKKEKIDVWQINNKEYLIRIFNIINTGLNRNNIVLDEKKKLYEEMVYFLYNNIK
tara:strand:- start:680 stop:847 length:168 start_codon:yes stop_codon:yes gene_type:complete